MSRSRGSGAPALHAVFVLGGFRPESFLACWSERFVAIAFGDVRSGLRTRIKGLACFLRVGESIGAGTRGSAGADWLVPSSCRTIPLRDFFAGGGEDNLSVREGVGALLANGLGDLADKGLATTGDSGFSLITGFGGGLFIRRRFTTTRVLLSTSGGKPSRIGLS